MEGRGKADARASARLWARCRAGDGAARAGIIARYRHLADITAGRFYRKDSPQVEQADLVGFALQGLVKAVDGFDAGRGVKFETFAIRVIRGQVMEGLRESDPTPRSIRDSARKLDAAIQAATQAAGRTPAPADVARALGTDEDGLARAQSLTARVLQVSADTHNVGESETEPLFLIDAFADEGADTAAGFEARERAGELAAVMAQIPEREALVLRLFYFEGLHLCEIAEALGVSGSRGHQIKARALARCRALLGEAWAS